MAAPSLALLLLLLMPVHQAAPLTSPQPRRTPTSLLAAFFRPTYSGVANDATKRKGTSGSVESVSNCSRAPVFPTTTVSPQHLTAGLSEMDTLGSSSSNTRRHFNLEAVIYCPNAIQTIRYNSSEQSWEMSNLGQGKGQVKEIATKRSGNTPLPDRSGSTDRTFDDNDTRWSSVGEEKEGGEIRCLLPTSMSPLWLSIIKDRKLLCAVNPHWLSFDPPSPLSHVILAAVYLLMMVVGILGNGVVIYLFICSRALRSPSNLFIFNLALSDLLLVAAMVMVVYNSLHHGPATGSLGCVAYGFSGGLTGTTSIMSLAAISLDRYLVISFPLDPFKRLSHRQVLGLIILTWLYAFTFSLVPLVGLPDIRYSPEGYLTTCSFDYLSEKTGARVFILSFFVAAWVVPLVLISFSYLSIVTTVSAQERHCHACQAKVSNSFRHKSLKRKKGVEMKLAKVASGIIGLWVVAWTPYAVVALLGVCGQRNLLTPLSSMAPALFCKTAACLDPFIYALSHPRFKAELLKRFGWCRRSLLAVRRGGINPVSSVSYSDREERELSELFDTNDPSNTSLGPLLQRNTSCSSGTPATSDRTRRTETVSSPCSKSLASPTTAEVYPRRSLSTYSFRSSRSIKGQNTTSGQRKPDLELRTTTLIDLPGVSQPSFPNPNYPHSCSSVQELWGYPSQAHNPSNACDTVASLKNVTKTKNWTVRSTEVTEPSSLCHRSCLAVAVVSLSEGLSPGQGRKGRSNSLPDMSHIGLDNGTDAQLTSNVFIQLFKGKVFYDVAKRRRRSSTSSARRETGDRW